MEEKNQPSKTPEEQVENFVAEFKLEAILTPEFNALNEAQKLKVTQDLKRRIVDLVKSDAQTQYSESLKGKTIFKSISKSITKERDLKNLEHKVFEELKNSQEGKEIIAEDLKRLTEITTRQEVFILGDKGKAYVRYFDGLDITNLTHEEALALTAFNQKTFEFTQMPYEWGQEKGGKHKKDYDKAKAKYEQARSEVLKIKTDREKPDEKGKAMLEMLERNNAIQLEQLLNTHPEFEQTLSEFAESADGMEWKKTFRNLFTTSSTTKDNLGAILGGAGLRWSTKTLSLLAGSAAGAITFAAAPIIGGVVGYIRGGIRGKSTLEERQKAARHGQKDESAEANKTVKADKMAEHLEDIMKQLNDPSCSDVKRIGLLKRLKIRIDVAQRKIDSGLMDFGDAKSALNNQFNLINNLNEAVVISASADQEIMKDVDNRIEKILLFRVGKISQAQKEFIRGQMKKGAMMGAGFATIGYLAHWAGEQLDWWGNSGVETSKPKSAEGFMERAEKWMSKMTERMKNPLGGTSEKELPVNTSDEDILGEAYAEDLPISSKETLEDMVKRAPGVVSEKIAVNPDAIIGKGEGIEHALRRQIEENPELAKYLGYKEGTDLHKFSGGAAHRMALDHGYVDKATGEEIRIKTGDKVAYEIKMENGQPVINERMVDGTLRESHGGESEFEQDIEKDYEYKHSKYQPVEKTADIQALEKKMESKIDDAVDKLKIERTEQISDLKTEISEAVKAPTVEEVRATVIEKMEITPEPRPNTIRTGTTVRTGTEIGTGYNPTPGQTIGGTNINYHGNSFWPQGGGTPEYAYPDLSPEDNVMLINIQKAHPEFSSNYYGLSGIQMLAAYDAHGENIHKIFPENTDTMWGKFKAISAQEIMFTDPENAGKEMKSLVSYINKLKELSDLKPKGTMLGFRQAETSEHFIVRAMQKIATQPEKLAKLKASLQK